MGLFWPQFLIVSDGFILTSVIDSDGFILTSVIDSQWWFYFDLSDW